MKKTTSIGMVLVSSLVGAVLVGDRYVMEAHAQYEAGAVETNLISAAETNVISAAETNVISAADTNVVSNAETNLPPLNSLLGSSLPQEIDPASPFGQLVRLVQAGVESSVILAYIQNSPRFFELDADDIIYLTDLGTPPEVIEAIMAHDQTLFEEGLQPSESMPDESAVVVDEEPPEISDNEFYDTLSPYGTWVYIEGYGRCWRPTVVAYNSSWRPYCDNGRWVYTDRGWYWVSNYSWGWATFHYGRWFRHARYGWCWWPDSVWAPSWVCWRYDNDYYGWAPLPPHTLYRSGVGLVYRGSTVGVGFHFNLNYDCYTFVSSRNFCDPYPRRHCVDRDRVKHIYDRTRIECRYDLDRNRRTIINRGLPVRHVSAATRQEITPVSIRYRTEASTGSAGYETLDRNRRSVVVNRYDATRYTPSAEQRRSTSPQRVTRPGTGRQDNPGPSVRTDDPVPATRSSLNRQPNPSRSDNRGTVTQPRQTTPRQTSPRQTPPRQSSPNRSDTRDTVATPRQTTPPSTATRSGNVTRRPPVAQREVTVTPPRPAASRRDSNGSSQGSQRSAQVRQQRPSTPPATTRNRQVQPNNSGRSNQAQPQAGNNRTQPEPQVNRSRRPAAPPRATPPARSGRTRNVDE